MERRNGLSTPKKSRLASGRTLQLTSKSVGSSITLSGTFLTAFQDSGNYEVTIGFVTCTDILTYCRERELLHRVFTEKRAGIYVGIDPTAPSMHVGHMLPFMVLAWGYVWGLPVTFLVS